MIGLDTNVLVRYVVQDDPVQAVLAKQLIESLSVEQPGFIAVPVVLELVWVLQSCYGAPREQLAQVIDGLLRARELLVQHAGAVALAVRQFQGSNADFADCLIAAIARQNGCERTMTFDRAAARSAGMMLLA